MSTAIQAIETTYGGKRFRSRLEARWAVFFTRLGLTWEYEERGGWLVGRLQRPYLPDFYLPELGLYVEIKPAFADQHDPDGVSRWEDFAAMVCTEWDHDRTALFIGPIPDPDAVDGLGPPRSLTWYEPGIVILGDWHYAWCACPSGQHYDIAPEARGGRIFCGCPRLQDDHYRTGDDQRILNAYGAARTARFEHGQTPRVAH